MENRSTPEGMIRHPEVSKKEAETKSFLDKMYDSVANGKRQLELLMDDPTVSEAAKATARTIINTAIAIVDVVPGFGEVFSWGADAVKAADRIRRLHLAMKRGVELKQIPPSVLDLTPDVGISVAVLTEAIEPLTAGIAPSHAIEGSMQLYHDWPRMRAGVNRAREILKADADRVKDPKVQEAIKLLTE